jgi:hypothetical protein
MLLALLLAPLASAEPEPDKVTFRATGHAKGFFVALLPYDNPILPDRAQGTGAVDTRLNLSLRYGEWLELSAAHAITATVGDTGAGGLTQTGVGAVAPEAVDLTWEAFGAAPQCDDDEPDCEESPTNLSVIGRTDRLQLKVSVPQFDLTLGRQPITFGSGLFFTPLDLVSPFSVATIDSEYKPGVDALRLDGYFGLGTRLTGVVAYTGSWDTDGLTAALYGQTLVGVTDLGLFYGWVRGDHVVGASMVTGVGPVGLHADAAVTVPTGHEAEDPFFRGVFGVDGRPTPTTTLAGELYVQTVGSADPADLLVTLSSPRYQRGELWLGGLAYAGLSLSQEITPTLFGNLASFVNLTDGSVFLSPSLSWSVSNNADVAFGGFVGLGRRPEAQAPELTDDIDLEEALLRAVGTRSEFGTYPANLFLQVRAYW